MGAPATVGLVLLAVLTVASLGAFAVVEAIKPLGSLSIAHLVDKVGLIAKDFHTLPDEKKDALRRNVGNLSRELSSYGEAWRNPPASP